MAKVEVNLSARFRWWVKPFFECLTFACVITAFFSFRSAEELGDWGADLIVDRGLVLDVSGPR